MPQHTVFRFPTRTSFEDLTSYQEDIPRPTSHEVLIKVRAISLNSRDCQIATSNYPSAIKDRLIPGSDAAGDIVDVGDAVHDFAKGDRVVTCFDVNRLYGPAKHEVCGQAGGGVDGVMAQYIVRPASAVVKVPVDSPQAYSELASLVCTGVTVWNAFYGNKQLLPGQTVLVQGTGGTSMTALVLAKAAGATTIITSSSDEKLRTVKEKYNADHCINYIKTPDWASEAVKLTEGKGVDHIIEIGGFGTIQQSLSAVARGGIITIIGYLAKHDPAQPAPDILLLALKKEAILRGIQVGPRCMLEDLVTFVSRRKLRFQIDREFGFSREDVVAAYNALASGKHVGKICILVD
ncbi:zinc-dependent alcohol dehydrogenase family protein [Aspergillus undulatus]|uniref:zinc-dependent alcohol dehydrogenase family protein n=1 Tax=Aspergillus undulatus TaxID=1810928 RepID=UPI003CCDC22F